MLWVRGKFAEITPKVRLIVDKKLVVFAKAILITMRQAIGG